MDLDTFLTTLYVLVDDWYKAEGAAYCQRRKAGRQRMSDSEVLTLAIAGQWQQGVPWWSERSLVRYVHREGQRWFPQMLGYSAFNQRVRNLCAGLAALQRQLAQWLGAKHSPYEVMDGLPLPVCSLGHTKRSSRHWLGMTSSFGHGGNHGPWFYGQRWWVSVSASGAITGWVVGAAHLNERWLVEGLLSTRAGDGCLHLPAPDPHARRADRPTLPGGFIGGFFAAGSPAASPYLTDRGLNGRLWRAHWLQHYRADVIAIPPRHSREFRAWTAHDCRWHAHHRQVIETVYAILETVFSLRRLHAHSLWGQYTRLSARAAAFNFALWLNRALGRPRFAVATLLS